MRIAVYYILTDIAIIAKTALKNFKSKDVFKPVKWDQFCTDNIDIKNFEKVYEIYL